MPKQSHKTSKHGGPKHAKVHAKEHPAIEVSGLCVAYDDIDVLHDISFTIGEGQIAAVIGPNGSGKTTLLKAMLGLVKKSSGKIEILRSDIDDVRHLIGYVPQRFSFDQHFPITVREFMNLARHKHNPKTEIEKRIVGVGLEKSVLDKKIGTLSGGQLQRVLIAQAMLNDPKILILDEPSTGIDIVGEAAFVDILKHINKKHKATILLVSHDVSMVLKFVDTVVCINGKLYCAGPPQTALTQRKLDDLYSGEAHLYEHKH
ncbi:MAG: metal ABC transporter ATP-binding protein [bacterium]